MNAPGSLLLYHQHLIEINSPERPLILNKFGEKAKQLTYLSPKVEHICVPCINTQLLGIFLHDCFVHSFICKFRINQHINLQVFKYKLKNNKNQAATFKSKCFSIKKRCFRKKSTYNPLNNSFYVWKEMRCPQPKARNINLKQLHKCILR